MSHETYILQREMSHKGPLTGQDVTSLRWRPAAHRSRWERGVVSSNELKCENDLFETDAREPIIRSVSETCHSNDKASLKKHTYCDNDEVKSEPITKAEEHWRSTLSKQQRLESEQIIITESTPIPLKDIQIKGHNFYTQDTAITTSTLLLGVGLEFLAIFH